MKVYAIGDVHGCLSEMNQLLAKIDARLKPGDEVVFIGDYIDRGPDSKGVVDVLIERQKNHPNKHVFIKGNHEDLMMSGDYWFQNGGDKAVKSYGLDPLDWQIERSFYGHHCPPDHRAFYSDLVLYYNVGKVVFVHAGIDPDRHLDQQSESVMIWARGYDRYNGEYVGGYTVVRGHTPVNDVVETRNQIMIDTACVFGHKLTCLVIDPNNPEDRDYLSVKSEQPAW